MPSATHNARYSHTRRIVAFRLALPRKPASHHRNRDASPCRTRSDCRRIPPLAPSPHTETRSGRPLRIPRSAARHSTRRRLPVHLPPTHHGTSPPHPFSVTGSHTTYAGLAVGLSSVVASDVDSSEFKSREWRPPDVSVVTSRSDVLPFPLDLSSLVSDELHPLSSHSADGVNMLAITPKSEHARHNRKTRQQ